MAKGPARNSPALGREIPREKGVGNGAISALTPCIFKTAFWILLGGKKMGKKKKKKNKRQKEKEKSPSESQERKKNGKRFTRMFLKIQIK